MPPRVRQMQEASLKTPLSRFPKSKGGLQRDDSLRFAPLYAVNDTRMTLVGASTDVRYAVAVYSPCSGSVKLKDAEALIPPVGSWT